jgi:hypothetical protein
VVIGGTFLVARCQSAALLAAIDEALDPVAETVARSIERPGTAFVPLARDGDPDARLAGIAPNPPAAVAFVPHDAVRAAPGAAWASPLDGPGLQERLEDPRLVALPRGEDDGHQLAAPVGAPVDCGPEPAPAPTEGCGFWVPFFAPAAC